jgi:hypothetical protein
MSLLKKLVVTAAAAGLLGFVLKGDDKAVKSKGKSAAKNVKAKTRSAAKSVAKKAKSKAKAAAASV